MRDSYFAGQSRWLVVVQTLSFVGLCVSVYGFSRMSYWTLIFALPLAVMVLEMCLSARTSSYRRRIDAHSHRRLVATYQPAHWPSVDVFLPTAGEPLAVLRNTYRHVAGLQWPGALTVYVLDDAGDPRVDELAAEFGFTYLARPTHEYKKAGNLQYGFDRSSGELVTILDADFVPRADYVHELVPYFQDASIGIVQSPQHFRTDTGQSWLERTAGATQELFYRFTQPSRDAVDAAICVGTSAFYRRRALAEIGGFPQVQHSEDVYTGVELAKVGYTLRYVPVIVSTGACPTRLSSFVGQQYRWCEGSMRLALDRSFHESPALTWRQRLCFWSGFVYYISTALTVYAAPIPAIVMLWLLPEHVSPINMLPLVGAFLLWFAVYPAVFQSRWRVDVLRVQTLYSFAHARAIYDVFRARTSDWVPTGTATTHSAAASVRRTILFYLVPAQILLFAGLGLRVAHDGMARYWAITAFALLNAYVFVPVIVLAAREVRGRPRHRRAVRQGRAVRHSH